jgi:hypothetical protein
MDIQGLRELQSQLKQLPEKAKRQRLLAIIKNVTGPVLSAAQREVNAIEMAAQSAGRLTTGNLYGSLGFVTGRSKEYPNIQVAPRVSGRAETYWRKRSSSGGRRKSAGSFNGFHAHLVHFGTGARKTRKGFNRGSGSGNPFMQRAFDKTLPSVRPNFEAAIAKEVERLAKQNIVPKF